MASLNISNRDKLKQFFFPPASGCGPLLIWLFWITLHLIALFVTAGLLLLLTIPLQIYFHRKKKNSPKQETVTGTEIDHIFEEECALLKKRSLERLGVDQSQVLAAPIEFFTPSIYRVRIVSVPTETQGLNPDDVEFAIGDKKIKFAPDEYCAIQKQEAASSHMRYSLVHYVILYPTTSFIACYSCKYSRVNGQIFGEKSQEIYYTDVTQIFTEEEHGTETREVKIGVGADAKEIFSKTRTIFKLEISSGSSIDITLDDPEMRKHFGSFGIPDDYAQSACMALRKLVREKKGH